MRILVLVLGLLCLAVSASASPAACRAGDVTGQWQHLGDDSHWVFFSNKRASCRICLDWKQGCRYVPDASDKTGRKQCEIAVPGATDRATTRVTGWDEENGVLAGLLFSDGSRLDVGAGCRIDREEGTMTIPGIGTMDCLYNYHCNKLRDPE